LFPQTAAIFTFIKTFIPGGFFQYNKDPNKQVFIIRRLDRESGNTENVTGGGGGAIRPQISHDGKTLSFIRRVRTKTVLFLRNLETGEEWPVYDNLSKDQTEAWTTFGAFTNYAFTPDDKFIIIWSNGKLNKIDLSKVNSGTDIPFTVQVNQKIADAVRFKQNINPTEFKVNVIRQVATSPDEKTIVFHALGYLYKKELPNGNPVRLTTSSDFEFEPAFSADGKKIVFTTWNDSTAGAMFTLDINTPDAKPVKITQKKGIYREPSFSPDGNRIVYVMEDGDNVLGAAFTSQPGIYVMQLNQSAPPRFVNDKGTTPRFNKQGNRIYYIVGDGMNRTFASSKPDGDEERVHLKSTYGSQFTVSPDGQWIAFVDLHNVYVASFPITGKTVDLGSTTTDFPVKKIFKNCRFNIQLRHTKNKK